MTSILDELETRAPQQREQTLLSALPQQIAHAQQHSAAFASILKGVDATAITSRAALAMLPVTRKSELLERQQQARLHGGDVFGGFASIGFGVAMPRVFASPGPIYEPEGLCPDYWRMARALRAAGFQKSDLVHNSFSYHFTPAGSMMETAAHALGCTVFPAGVGQTEQQVQAIAELKPTAYVGTPSFLRLLIEKGQELKQPIRSIQKALVSGEALPPSLRKWFEEHGIEAYQAYGTADLGLIAYETQSREGLVVDEGVLLEIVRPGTGDPLPDGEVGELVVTTLNPDYPLIRFGTGDLSAVLPGNCPTGRSNVRIKGWLGRADQTTKVRGMFVHPGQVAEVVRRFPAIRKARLVVSGEMANDQMELRIEVAEAESQAAEAVGAAVREVTKLRCDVVFVETGALPNDGKVIDDIRRYE